MPKITYLFLICSGIFYELKWDKNFFFRSSFTKTNVKIKPGLKEKYFCKDLAAGREALWRTNSDGQICPSEYDSYSDGQTLTDKFVLQSMSHTLKEKLWQKIFVDTYNFYFYKSYHFHEISVMNYIFWLQIVCSRS